MKTVQYLDAVKEKAGIASDYALAKRLGLTTSAISNYRHGRSSPDNLVAVRVAGILGIDPMVVIADIELERATHPELREVWRRLASKVAAGVLLPVTLGAGSALAPAPADASMLRCAAPAVYYVKFRELLRLLGFPIPDDMLA